jgi:hypothetical protein
MRPAYCSANDERGRGSHARRRAAVEGHVRALRDGGSLTAAARAAAAALRAIAPEALLALRTCGAGAAQRLTACFPEAEDAKFTRQALDLKARTLAAAREAAAGISQARPPRSAAERER